MSARIARSSGWALLLVIGAILLVFSLIGILHSFRGTPIERVHIAGTGDRRLEVSDPSFRATAEALTGARLTAGNRVEILLNDEVLRRLWSDLRSARSSIAIRNYYALPGSVADSLASILIEKAREGVQVLFLYDAFGSEFSRGYLGRLTGAGVVVRGFRPLRWYNLSRAQNRSHVRAVVIDGVVGYTGGFGIADVWRGEMIHAKTIVVDGLWSAVGTMNFDNRSAALNEESNLVMLDAGLGARMDSIFLHDLRHAREIRLADFVRRPWHQKVRERTATLLSRIL